VLADRPPVLESWSEEQKEAFKRICGAAMLKANYDIPF
jgi:hypothetical protein